MSAPTFAQKMSNIKYMPVLLAATSATKDPADGYLVKDIIKMSFDSSQARLFLQQYLVNQLITTNNVFSKIKVLRLFLVLLEEGHIEFKQNLRKSPEPFNEASKLRPHQPKDQKLVAECGRIRDMANKVLDLLYSEVPELRRPVPSFDSPSTDENFGSNSNGSGSRIIGFGNTGPAAKPSTTDKLKALFGSTGKTNTVVYDPNYATMDPVPHNTTSSSPFLVHVPQSVSSTHYQGEAGRPSGVAHERGQAGGGWGGDDSSSSYKSPHKWSSSSSPSSKRGGGQQGEEEREHFSSTGEDLSTYEEASIEQEQRLVDDIMAPGGVRAAPPRETLNKFINRCKSLDCLSIIECLRMKLADGEPQTVLRSLFVIEAFLRSDIPDILSHMDIVLQDLSDLASSSNSSIKAKANKILVQLNAAERVSSSGGTGSRTGTGQQQQLTSSGDDEQVEENDEEAETNKTATEDSGLGSIFSGLSVSGEKSQRPPKQSAKKRIGKQTVAKTSPSTSARGNKSKKETEEQSSAFGDILGLGDISSEQVSSGEPASNQGMLTMNPHQSLEQQQEEEEEEDNSLLTFEEDVEFDPLKRNNSLDFNKSGSFSKKILPRTGGAALETSVQPSMGSPAVDSKPSLNSTNLLNDLSGISLGPTTSSSASKPSRQESLTELLQPLQTSSVPQPMNIGGNATMVMGSSASGGMIPYPHQQGMIQIVSAAGPAPSQQGQVPLTLSGGVVYGGGVPNVVPVMYAAPPGQAAQGTAGVMYMNQPQYGGVARPVQRAAASKDQTPPPDGFGFLGKSNKNNAFDFVQDEMKATRTKK